MFCLTIIFCSVFSTSSQAQDVRLLTKEQNIERELKSDEAHSYRLNLEEGQFLSVIVEQKGIDVIVTLFDSSNQKVAEVDSPNGTQGPEPLSIIVESKGNYLLEVRSLEKNAPPGHYEIKIKELRQATDKDKNIIIAQRVFNEGELLRLQSTTESLRSAIKKYEESLIYFRASEDKNGEAKALNNIGFVNGSLGEQQKALENFTLALPLWKAVGDKTGEATTLNNIGFVNGILGEQQKALEYYRQALPLLRAVENKEGEARALNNIGLVLVDLGNRQKALENYNQALPLWKAVGDKSGEATTLTNIGYVYSVSGEPQKALEFYELALPIMKAIGNKTGEAYTLDNIGWEFSNLGEYQKALENYAQAVPLLRVAGDKSGEATTLGHLGGLMNKIGNRRFAVVFDKYSVNRLQELRSNISGLDKNIKQTYLKSIDDIYYQLADILLIDGRLAEAQQTLNSFKDQQFFDFDAQSKQLTQLKLTPNETEFVANYNSLADKVGEADNKFGIQRRTLDGQKSTVEGVKVLKDLENRLAISSNEFLEFLRKSEKLFNSLPDERDQVAGIIDLQTLQKTLRQTSAETKENTVAIYTLVGEKNYRSLVITSDGIFSTSYPITGADLNQKALQLWKLLRTPDYDPQPIASELYQIIFAPIAAKLPKDTKTILWSLDGNLRYLPMASLHDGKQYLVERFNNVIFTRSDEERLTRDVSRHWTGTGLGSSQAQSTKVFETTYKFQSLPSVKTELFRIFKNDKPNGIFLGDILLDSAFTKPAMITALKNRRPLVHIASHFKFEAGDESRSFLLLGDGTAFTLDEMKTEKELFGGVELLTLSACQTAAQRPDANGREVDGFAELAQRLGAGAIMASLWELSDDSTAELMTRFYETYNRSKVNKAEALRTAQLALLKGDYKEKSKENRGFSTNDEEILNNIKIDQSKMRPYKSPRNAPFAHPFYWSPFVLFGNWK